MHGPARYLAPCVAALLLGSTTGLADGARGPADDLASLAAARRSAALQLYAIESSLAGARGRVAENTRRERALQEAHRRAVVRSVVLRRSLVATQDRIATLLRRLYVEGSPEPLAVVLGARSLSAALDGIDSLTYATRRNRRLASEALARSNALQHELHRLRRARDAVAAARRRSETLAAELEAAAREKRATLDALSRREDLTKTRLAKAEAQAKAAEHASRHLAPPVTQATVTTTESTAPATAGDPTPVATDTTGDTSLTDPRPQEPGAARTLVVDAVAYHLPGHTASGLPVGIGVIAVDPGVIPLGTRVYVPGYGPAVAADTGTAIKGAIIDLWMPSTAAALAWGRRTVTITVYG
jgi:3D (Asp-Asp-Asp) domain-containing protein